MQSSVFGPILSLLYTLELFSILENKLIGFVDDSILMAVVPNPGIKVAGTETLNHDLSNVSEWSDLLGNILNERKTETMIVSQSCTMHPQSPPLTIGGIVLKESDGLDKL